jgi:hypothetical protein
MRKTALAALPLLAGACAAGVDDIQQRDPVRTMNFTGPHRDVAYCVQGRLNGRLRHEAFRDTFVIYDSVKRTQHYDGVSHYSVTVAPAGPDRGTADVRVVFIPDTPELARERRRRAHAGDIRISPVEKYWTTIQDCVTQVNERKKG